MSYRMFRFMVNPKQALIAEAKRLVKDALTGKSKSIYEYGSYVYYETGSPAFGGGIAGCLFPGKSRMSHILFLLLILAETAVAHATIPDGWWFLLPGVVSVLLRLSFKGGTESGRSEKPCSPFTPRAGQLSDIITGSPISLFMEEPVPARPNP